jgi:hypothetical protein
MRRSRRVSVVRCGCADPVELGESRYVNPESALDWELGEKVRVQAMDAFQDDDIIWAELYHLARPAGASEEVIFQELDFFPGYQVQ